MKRDRKPDWTKWRLTPDWALWEAVALSLNIEPKAVKKKAWNGGLNPSNFLESPEFVQRAEILYRIVESRRAENFGLKLQLEPGAELAATIRPVDFLHWVETEANEWRPLPVELVEIAQLRQPRERLKSGKWPWGDHDTHLLRCMEAAAEKWWANYDPTDPTTAPNKERQVVPWLKDKFQLSDRKADAIDMILRIEGLPKGPRG